MTDNYITCPNCHEHISLNPIPLSEKITSAAKVAEMLVAYGFKESEEISAILLNGRNMILSIEMITKGSVNTTGVHIGEIFKQAIRKNVAGVILVHNHPSGDASPSQDDKVLTKRVIEAGTLLGIPVLDHIILARGNFFSMREIDTLEFPKG